jgi:hypothetical protein
MADSVTYLKQLSTEATKYGLATGLKNAEEMRKLFQPPIIHR